MPHDEARVRNTKEWFIRTLDDLNVAGHDLKSESPFVRAAMFHCQQAAEKELKGFLTWHDRPFEKTHDLRKLGEQCVEVDVSLEQLLRRAMALTKYAWKFRYPGALFDPPLEEAQTSLTLAREVVTAILDRLPSEIRP